MFVSLGHSFFKTTTLYYILESSGRQDHVNPDPCTDNVLFETNTSDPKIVNLKQNQLLWIIVIRFALYVQQHAYSAFCFCLSSNNCVLSSSQLHIPTKTCESQLIIKM